MNVTIAGGGTAGHVIPAIALARELDGHDVSFIGTVAGSEARLVPAAGFALETIEVVGFDRSKPLRIPATGIRAVTAVRRARAIVQKRSPDVVVGVGGYVSLPVCVAARSLRTPVVLHEQNIVLGLANKICSRFARRIAVSFEETLQKVGERGVMTGNPVLPELAAADFSAARRASFRRFELDPDRKTLLVFGGSQGARRINSAAAGLAEAWRDRADLQILHLTGRVNLEAVREQVARAEGSALIYRTLDYLDGMVPAYAVADLALCRGGATTVAELGVAGLPAVIVPYPYHRDRQQERHGRVLEGAGAAIVLDDAAATTDAVARIAGRILSDDDVRARMSASASEHGVPDAASRLARVVEEVARAH